MQDKITMELKMIHLTLTGPYAGAPYCGAMREHGGQYAHANYEALQRKAYRARVCKKCLSIYDEAARGTIKQTKNEVREI